MTRSPTCSDAAPAHPELLSGHAKPACQRVPGKVKALGEGENKTFPFSMMEGFVSGPRPRCFRIHGEAVTLTCLPPGFEGDGGLLEGVEIAASGEVWGRNTFAGWGLSLVLQYEWAPS